MRPAPKIFKDTCRIDWTKGVKAVYDFVRGLSPYPAAWTELVNVDGSSQVLKIFQTEKNFFSHGEKIGAVSTDGKTYLRVALSDGYLNILSLQLAGKKRMPVADFLRGFKAVEGLCVR